MVYSHKTSVSQFLYHFCDNVNHFIERYWTLKKCLRLYLQIIITSLTKPNYWISINKNYIKFVLRKIISINTIKHTHNFHTSLTTQNLTDRLPSPRSQTRSPQHKKKSSDHISSSTNCFSLQNLNIFTKSNLYINLHIISN